MFHTTNQLHDSWKIPASMEISKKRKFRIYRWGVFPARRVTISTITPTLVNSTNRRCISVEQCYLPCVVPLYYLAWFPTHVLWHSPSSYNTQSDHNLSVLFQPIGSMYAIYCNIYHQYTPNVNIYTIHGSYGLYIYIYTRICMY